MNNKCNTTNCCENSCGSIGSLFDHKVIKKCETLKLSEKSDINITWCKDTATVKIDPCNFLQSNFVRCMDGGCIFVELLSDPTTGECFYGLSSTSRYFGNGVAFKRGYNGIDCNWNLPMISSDNTVSILPADLGGGDMALDFKVNKRPQSMIFYDSSGAECQVDTQGPIKFHLDSPCWSLECSPDNDAVTFTDNSDLGINGVKFNCSQIFFRDPSGQVTFTPNPVNPSEILVSHVGCQGFSSATVGANTIEADCSNLEFTAGEGLIATAIPSTNTVNYSLGTVPVSKICVNDTTFRFWAGKTFGSPGGPPINQTDYIPDDFAIHPLSTVSSLTGVNFTPWIVGPFATDVYLDVTIEADGQLLGGTPDSPAIDIGVTIMVLFNGNWVVSAPVTTLTPTGDTGGSGPYALSCDLPTSCSRGINMSHRALARLAAGGVTTIDMGIVCRGKNFGLQSRKIFLEVKPICN
jgi:hypothetical protein